MGKAEDLPDNQVHFNSLTYYTLVQFDVAAAGAETDTMPEQARELVARLHKHYTDEELAQKWVMILITVGKFLSNIFV